MGTLLRIRDVSIRYGKVEAVHHVSIDVPRGSIVTVIGPNGAGKTTLLSAAMGLLAFEGEIDFDGDSLAKASIEDRVARGICLVPERRELFGEMSVADNLQLGAFCRYRRGDREIRASLDEVFALFPRLAERRAQFAGTLSGGERQMLALGRALMGRPQLLMLDEPSLGLAPRIVREIFHTITRLKGTGVSILLVEQNARAALQVADHGYVLETGEVVLAGPSSALANDPRVLQSYLGQSA